MSAGAFYIGAVSHQRLGRVRHRLRYRIAYVLVDLDRAAEADRDSRLLGVDRSAPLAVRARDHGPIDAPPQNAAALAAWVRALLRARGVTASAARIELLTLPRMFGFVFNPISVYLVRDSAGALHHVLYEVNNTFGERLLYLVTPGGEVGKGVREDVRHPRGDLLTHLAHLRRFRQRDRIEARPPGRRVIENAGDRG